MKARMTPDGYDVTIIGEPANINYFVKTDFEPDEVGAVVDKQSQVKSSKRRRYVGDTEPVNVSSHSREYMFDPGRRNGAADPGKPFILDDGVERRRFGYIGSLKALHAYLRSDADMEMRLYSPSASYLIPDSDDDGGTLRTKK